VAPTVVSIQTKNSGTATIIVLIAGFFGFNGIGHIYIGKTSFGIGLMIIGWILAFLTPKEACLTYYSIFI
jgi:TM2 domain-containing membrane protein YozV